MRRHIAVAFVPTPTPTATPSPATAMLILARFGMLRDAFDVGFRGFRLGGFHRTGSLRPDVLRH